MRHWLATAADQQAQDWIKRFDPRFWTVDFPRPMVAAITTPAPRSLRVDLSFLKGNDLAGLIWESADRHDHPLLGYATARDYRGLRLSFRWQVAGAVLPLDAVNGPTLTIEGRDAAGTLRSWYVRLWNYAVGTPTDALVTLDFDTLAGGFLLPGEADPVWAGDIDRLFVSLVPAGYTGADAPLAAPVEASVTISDITCDGPGSTLVIGDTFVPPHRLRIATGYDDSYNLTPARLLRGIVQTGYGGFINHYVGMSHFFQLRWTGTRFEVDPARALNAAAAAWHRDFVGRAAALGFTIIWSLSFELLAEHAPATWAQRDADGAPATTGYTPPSTLLSPASVPAMTYLQSVAQAFVALAVAAGQPPHFQIGEPWWWVGPDHRPCLYDAATTALYAAETGLSAPLVRDVRGVQPPAVRAYLDWLGGVLGRATLSLRDAVPAATHYLLFYAPQVIDAAAPELIRANLPAAWAAPAFDVLQLEDYDFVTRGDFAGQAAARALIATRLGYPPARQHYFAGYVASASDGAQWPLIAEAAAASLARGTAETFVWAWPQVARDGFVAFQIRGEETMPAFHDVRFPLELGYGASGGPQFATQIAVTASGFEQRNSSWSDARLHYDAGVGVRSEADLATLLGFFRARRGQAHAFRFNDPLDRLSGSDAVTPLDQALGTGDGVTTRFALAKRYGSGADAQVRRITRPVAGTVRVAVAGVARATGWTLGDGGYVDFAAAPAAGAAVTAGFEFDVPVRFADDRIDVSLAGWHTGDLPSVPLVEVREA